MHRLVDTLARKRRLACEIRAPPLRRLLQLARGASCEGGLEVPVLGGDVEDDRVLDQTGLLDARRVDCDGWQRDTIAEHLRVLHRLFEVVDRRGDAPHDRYRQARLFAVDKRARSSTCPEGPGVETSMRLVKDQIDGQAVVLDRVLRGSPRCCRRGRLARSSRRRLLMLSAPRVSSDVRDRRCVFRKYTVPGLSSGTENGGSIVTKPVVVKFLRCLHQTDTGLVVQVRIVREPDDYRARVSVEVEFVVTVEERLDRGCRHHRLAGARRRGERE